MDGNAPEFRYTPDKIAEEIREYVALVAQQGLDGMREQLSKHPGAEETFAERMIGYKDATEDMIAVFTDPNHRVYKHISMIAHQAQRLS